MSEEKVLIHTMQINMRNGMNVYVDVTDFNEFKAKREFIFKSQKEFVDVLDTCSIRREDVAIIEYYNVDASEIKSKNKKGGKNKWPRK